MQFNPQDYMPQELRQIYLTLCPMFEDSGINVAQELEEQYRKCREASDLALEALRYGDGGNSAGTLLNATTSALKELAKLRSEAYAAERVKVLQGVVTELIKESSDPDRWFAKLEEGVRRAGLVS